jgi:SAM-dependent methyltransferase
MIVHAMTLHQHEISESGHRILNPFSEAKLRLVGECAEVGDGSRVLDLACGKGELLCRWAEWFGSGGVGVDLSEVFVPIAEARARELGVADRVSFVRGDAAAYVAEPGAFDVACCIGATWIGNGIAGTVDLLRPAIRDGGRILIGEPYWTEPAPDEAATSHGFEPDEFASLDGTLDRLGEAGLELVEMVLASPDDWDRYEASQWRTIDRWLRANPDDPMHAEIRDALTQWRLKYVRWGRRYLGWGIFVTRPR